MSDLPLTPYHALQDLLECSYDDVELRILARWAFDTTEIFDSLPGTGTSARGLAFHIVEAVRKQYGTPPASFWQYLHTTRPGRCSQILQLQIAFGDEPIWRDIEEKTKYPEVVGAALASALVEACENIPVG